MEWRKVDTVSNTNRGAQEGGLAHALSDCIQRPESAAQLHPNTGIVRSLVRYTPTSAAKLDAIQ